MDSNIIVSNRLPIQITKSNDKFDFKPSTGGLATGLNSIHKRGDTLWIGWAGVSSNLIEQNQNKII